MRVSPDAAAILRQHPHTCPNKTKKSPALRFPHGNQVDRRLRYVRFNRTQEYRARLRKRRKDAEPESFPSEETVVLSHLPCWRHLSPEVYRGLVVGLVSEIESDAAAERKLTGQ